MPVKYHIHTHPTPPRIRPEGKLGIVDWREDCSSCKNCVKKGCVYNLYRDEADALHQELGYLDYIYQCKGCLTCIQNCTKNILTRVVNPEYERLGDGYYTPDIILTTWFQAESGAVPVSGCGYGGPFSGKGFDSMWTDMSEIVRPTRDGIHGREYINTGVDIGRKLPRLHFDGMNYTDTPPPILQSPLPLMFDAVAPHWRHPNVVSAINTAAGELGLFSIVPAGEGAPHSAEKRNTIVPLLDDSGKTPAGIAAAPMIIVQDSQKIFDTVAGLKKENAKRIVAVRLPAGGEAAARVVLLARQGIEVVNIVFDRHGMQPGSQTPRHMRDGLREVHKALVKEGIRDEVTLIASGGIALPEHMAKAIICGADLVTVDIPLILAMDCRLCGECERGEQCQVGLADIDAKYAAQRVINLMGSWHSQLLEMLGAMGIREARRLRGEVGRCMFFEDLEAAAFGRIFGKRKDAVTKN
jgi:ferredoxin